MRVQRNWYTCLASSVSRCRFLPVHGALRVQCAPVAACGSATPTVIAIGAGVSLSCFNINLNSQLCDVPLAVLLDLDGDFVRFHVQLSVKRC